MCIPYKKGIMQESHTYYLLSKYMDHTISTEELKTLRLLVNYIFRSIPVHFPAAY